MWNKLAYPIQFKLLVATHSEVTCRDLLSFKLFNIHVFTPLRYKLFKIKYLHSQQFPWDKWSIQKERKKREKEGENRTKKNVEIAPQNGKHTGTI